MLRWSTCSQSDCATPRAGGGWLWIRWLLSISVSTPLYLHHCIYTPRLLSTPKLSGWRRVWVRAPTVACWPPATPPPASRSTPSTGCWRTTPAGQCRYPHLSIYLHTPLQAPGRAHSGHLQTALRLQLPHRTLTSTSAHGSCLLTHVILTVP